MLNAAQNELLQQFLTMPDPTYAQIFEAQAERDELAEELEVKTAEYESLEDDLSSANNDKADNDERINALECALADAVRRDHEMSDHGADAFAQQAHTMKNRTLTNEGVNRIGDTISDLRIEVSRLRKIESAAVAAVEYEQWTGGTFYDLMIDLQKALRD